MLCTLIRKSCSSLQKVGFNGIRWLTPPSHTFYLQVMFFYKERQHSLSFKSVSNKENSHANKLEIFDAVTIQQFLQKNDSKGFNSCRLNCISQNANKSDMFEHTEKVTVHHRPVTSVHLTFFKMYGLYNYCQAPYFIYKSYNLIIHPCWNNLWNKDGMTAMLLPWWM